MDLIFFWLSKLIWTVISPDILLVILNISGLVLLLAGAVKKAILVLSVAAAATLAITFFPLGSLLLAPLENRFPSPPDLPEQVDGIICLGGAEKPYLSDARGQAEVGGAAERHLGFIKLMRTYPDAQVLFTGGSGSLTHQGLKDADVARMVFEDLGLDLSAIRFESRSRNTYENGKFSKDLVTPEPGQTWVLVTSADHMPRAVGVFRKLGWDVIAYPVDHATHPESPFEIRMDFSGNLHMLKLALREWVGLTAYYLTGKTSEWVPGPAGKGD